MVRCKLKFSRDARRLVTSPTPTRSIAAEQRSGKRGPRTRYSRTPGPQATVFQNSALCRVRFRMLTSVGPHRKSCQPNDSSLVSLVRLFVFRTSSHPAAFVPENLRRHPNRSVSSEITVFPALHAKFATAEFAAAAKSSALFAIDLKRGAVEVKAPQLRHDRQVAMSPCPCNPHDSNGKVFHKQQHSGGRD